jgi:voltage-gated potassium channel
VNDPADPVDDAADAVVDLTVRGCLGRSATSRERLAQHLYDRLHPAMAALGLFFVVLVLAQGPAEEGTTLQRTLLGATWLVWSFFVAEYVLRLVIAPSTTRFLRRTWWQLLFLVVPVLTLVRALLILRVARPTRVALAALRGGRSARATLTGRAAWLAVLTAIVTFASADVLYQAAHIRPYGTALHAAALAAVAGEPTGSAHGLAQVLDVVLAVYAVVFFAALAGSLGAFFLEQRQPATTTETPHATPEDSSTRHGSRH